MADDEARDNGNGNPLQWRFEELASDCGFDEYIVLARSGGKLFCQAEGDVGELASVIFNSLHRYPELAPVFALGLQAHFSAIDTDDGAPAGEVLH